VWDVSSEKKCEGVNSGYRVKDASKENNLNILFSCVFNNNSNVIFYNYITYSDYLHCLMHYLIDRSHYNNQCI